MFLLSLQRKHNDDLPFSSEWVSCRFFVYLFAFFPHRSTLHCRHFSLWSSFSICTIVGVVEERRHNLSLSVWFFISLYFLIFSQDSLKTILSRSLQNNLFLLTSVFLSLWNLIKKNGKNIICMTTRWPLILLYNEHAPGR